MTIEQIEEYVETTLCYIKWGKYETAISRLHNLEDMVIELKDKEFTLRRNSSLIGAITS